MPARRTFDSLHDSRVGAARQQGTVGCAENCARGREAISDAPLSCQFPNRSSRRQGRTRKTVTPPCAPAQAPVARPFAVMQRKLLLRRSAMLAKTRMRTHALSLSLSRRLPATGCTRRYTLRSNAEHQPCTGEAPCVACVRRIGRSPSDALRLRAQDIERRDSVVQQKPTRLCEWGSDPTHAPQASAFSTLLPRAEQQQSSSGRHGSVLCSSDGHCERASTAFWLSPPAPLTSRPSPESWLTREEARRSASPRPRLRNAAQCKQQGRRLSLSSSPCASRNIAGCAARAKAVKRNAATQARERRRGGPPPRCGSLSDGSKNACTKDALSVSILCTRAARR